LPFKKELKKISKAKDKLSSSETKYLSPGSKFSNGFDKDLLSISRTIQKRLEASLEQQKFKKAGKESDNNYQAFNPNSKSSTRDRRLTKDLISHKPS
jgi:hypothetical protein